MQRRTNNFELMKGELVEYTDAVKQVTGHNGKYYKSRFDDAVVNDDQYSDGLWCF